MSIAIPARMGLIVKKLAAERPDLTPKELARLAGTNRGYATKALGQETFGNDRVKSRAS